MSKGQTLQDPFLNSLRKDRIPVSIFLVNGIKLQGQIESFDQYVVLLKNTVSQMVYKHAISTVVPARNPRSATTMPNAGGFGQSGSMGYERTAGNFEQSQGYGVNRGGFNGRGSFASDRGGFAERGFDNSYDAEQRNYGLNAGLNSGIGGSAERSGFGNPNYDRTSFSERGFENDYEGERNFDPKGYEPKEKSDFDDTHNDDKQDKY